MKLLLIGGARPNFVKIAPLYRSLSSIDSITPVIVHTGQHYHSGLSKVFFEQLSIPEPHKNLEVGSGSQAWQTGQIMITFEEYVLETGPDMVVVVGDVNSTVACSLVAKKLLIPVAHVEAGLRSFDRSMPEEINRIVTDSVADLLFTTCEAANDNLLNEGIREERIHFVGNVMIDTLEVFRDRVEHSGILEELDLKGGSFCLLTLHRPSNVDNRETFSAILSAIEEIQQRLPVVYPVHPRSRKNLEELGLISKIESMPNLRLTDPIGYIDFLKLESEAQLVLTDSGGVQEETTVFNVPCLTLRENTERPITITEGTNILTGMSRDRIVEEALKILGGERKQGSVPALWDGQAAERIAQVVLSWSKHGE
jgi:UDP-N-acetylglucosamine 2-epimerase (non-hydrolysing)